MKAFALQSKARGLHAGSVAARRLALAARLQVSPPVSLPEGACGAPAERGVDLREEGPVLVLRLEGVPEGR